MDDILFLKLEVGMKKIFMGILFLISLNYAADFACVDFQKVLMQSK